MISYRYCTGASKGLGGLRHREISQWRIPSFLLLYILYIGVISALLDLIIKHSAYRFHHRSTRDIMNLIFKHRSLSLASLSEISFAPRTIPFAFIYIYIFLSLFPIPSYYLGFDSLGISSKNPFIEDTRIHG